MGEHTAVVARDALRSQCLGHAAGLGFSRRHEVIQLDLGLSRIIGGSLD